jgi:putative oxidoreductase
MRDIKHSAGGNMAVVSATTRSASEVKSSVTATEWGIFFIRIVLGIIFFAHGAQKALGWFGGPGLGGTVGFMGQIGIPAPLAYMAVFTELLGGLALIVGVLSRLSALGLFVTMLVAMFKVHWVNGFFMGSNPQGAGIEYNLALAAMALAIVLTGPGALGLWDPERKIFRR